MREVAPLMLEVDGARGVVKGGGPRRSSRFHGGPLAGAESRGSSGRFQRAR